MDGLIVRTVYAQVPPKVEYSLSELGSAWRPCLARSNCGATSTSGVLVKPRPSALAA